MTQTRQPEALRQKTSSMNERYTLTDGYMEFAPDEGEWVRWSDYSKMRAEYQGEVHSIKSQLEAAQAQLTRQHARIAELEDATDIAIERIAELEAQLSATIAEPVCKQAVPASVIAGAIYDFAGYLTTLPHKEAIHCSRVHDAAPMVKAINDWCKRRNLCTDDARVGSWREAIATQPAAQGMDAEIQQAVESERERICAAIKAEDDHCIDQGDYMLDSNDCIKIVRGKWVRPDYSLDAAQAKQGGV